MTYLFCSPLNSSYRQPFLASATEYNTTCLAFTITSKGKVQFKCMRKDTPSCCHGVLIWAGDVITIEDSIWPAPVWMLQPIYS